MSRLDQPPITAIIRAPLLPWGAVDCVQCERLRLAAIEAARAFHNLTADLECAYLAHDAEAPKAISIRLKTASVERDKARDELTLHENTHALKKRVATR